MTTLTPSFFRSINALGLIAISGVLVFAFYDQFYAQELPCPLCLLQRVGFVAVAIGLLMNVMMGSCVAHYAFSIVAALAGAAAALRQVSLHVIPGTPPYGEPFLGLHFYTWAFILFATIIFGLAILASFQDQYRDEAGFLSWSKLPKVCRAGVALSLLATLLNAVTTFALCGPGVCADDPSAYWIF